MSADRLKFEQLDLVLESISNRHILLAPTKILTFSGLRPLKAQHLATKVVSDHLTIVYWILIYEGAHAITNIFRDNFYEQRVSSAAKELYDSGIG